MRVATVALNDVHRTLWESWRAQARELLLDRVPPEAVSWCDGAEQASLFALEHAEAMPPAGRRDALAKLSIPKAFLELARSVAAHSDRTRWALLYRLLWRQTLGGERALLAMATDPDVRQAGRWAKAIGRDIHKMHAFVRFRSVDNDSEDGRECFVAWFEPEHDIVQLAAPFFQRRFAAMNWSILTPRECAHWYGDRLAFSPGVSRASAPASDAMDDLWRGYYRRIFNPARLKTKAMQAEMPKKYWKNLPEAELIHELIAQSSSRTQEMLVSEQRPAKPAPKNTYLQNLRRRNQLAADQPE